jgi:hypothetical protein
MSSESVAVIARRRAIPALAILGAFLGLAACSGASSSQTRHAESADVSPPGDIPDSQAFVTFVPTGGGYAIDVPEGWARTDLATGASFTDKLNSVRIERAAVTTAPTVGSARSDDVPTIEAATDGFRLRSVHVVHRPAGDAVLLKYRARGTPDAVTGKRIVQDVERYELWRNGTLATITLTSPKGADNVDPWRTVTTSFRWSG